MKKLTLVTILACSSFAYTGQVAAKNGYDICLSDQNPLAHGCTAAGMMDVPFDVVSNYSDKWDIKIIYNELEDRYKLFGFAKYYKELIDEADLFHERAAEDFVRLQNRDLADNYAYVLVVEESVQISINQDTEWHFWLDVIEGTDWDNNGKIDILEIHNLYGDQFAW